ncbi:uncharacterized protein DNG_05627 [Cephalotrichum gorgonifer]|uniref:Uncharacterized protein n=1 Tax=Cephalotrichum gorgonifer TaxID=2041049 RepID=A0AAE8N0T8_9PEZI|nr:uncharacterized protein DNG_05627 [Cephalotrichum gorgonifer]
MESLELDEIVTRLEVRGSAAVGSTADGLESVVVPLTWADSLIERRPDVLSRLCKAKPAVDDLCALCMSPGTSRCGSCGQRYYRKEAELTWCKLTSDPSGLEIAHPDVNRLSSCPLRGFTAHVNTSLATGRLFLGHGLAILDVYGLKELEKNGLLNFNKCINNLSAPGALAFYAGPHVVFAFEGNEVGLPAKGIDVVPNDWRYATDCIVMKPTNAFFTDLPSLAIPSAMSTKINNTKSLLVSKIYGIQKPIESVVAPMAYWPVSGPSALAFQIGLPWKTRYVLDCEVGTVSEDMKYLKRIYRPRPRNSSGDRSYDWVTTWKERCGSMIIMSIANIRVVHEHHVLAFNKYLDYSLNRCIVPSRKGFLEYWGKYMAVVSIRSDVTFLANPYHELPLSEELTVAPGEDFQYRKALVNLLGHFASRDWKMEVEEKDGVLIPKDVLVPFDPEGDFEFSEEDRDVPSGLKEVF